MDTPELPAHRVLLTEGIQKRFPWHFTSRILSGGIPPSSVQKIRNSGLANGGKTGFAGCPMFDVGWYDRYQVSCAIGIAIEKQL